MKMKIFNSFINFMNCIECKKCKGIENETYISSLGVIFYNRKTIHTYT